MITRFTGITRAAFEFYDSLVAENSKTWWTSHKEQYDGLVVAPLAALLSELEGEFGSAKIFRPYRDVRFAKDKTPYKEYQGAFIGAEDGMGWYVQVGRSGLMLAGGWYSPEGKQIQRYRDAVDSAVGGELEKALGVATKAGLVVGGDIMKTRPRGIPEDHPRLELLRHRTLSVSREYGTPAWVSTRGALTRIRTQWRAMTPLLDWLVDHVGPADDGIPPEPD